MAARHISVRLRVWRQLGPDVPGGLVDYAVRDISTEMSFLEMLDVVNEEIIRRGEEPIAFESDCREGICGACGLVINGVAHGPLRGGATCQLFMRQFQDGDTITVEPWRARAFPVVKDLVVDRSALDRILTAGGYISTSVGSAVDANAIPIARETAEQAMDLAECIGCGACVAACRNAAAHLFTAAKIGHLVLLPQGQVERKSRVVRMVSAMDREGFGACSNEGECEAVCPKSISIDAIARMVREYLSARLAGRQGHGVGPEIGPE